MSDSNLNSKIEIKLVGNTADQWPMLEKLWDFYSEKGVKTVFLSIGVGQNPMADLEIAETLGCPIHIYEVRDSVLKGWEEVQSILKTRKAPEVTNSFVEGVDSKWVLPKNIRIHKELPSFFNGSVELEGGTYPTKDVLSCVKECISSMNMKEEQIRVDLLKISLGNKYELPILQAFLTTGFRPGLVLIDWSELPDEDMASAINAGHLQNCGYVLLSNYGSRFLYLSNDRCMYDICSWHTNKSDNPMVSEIIKACTPPSEEKEESKKEENITSD
jgi:hypothetical protein